MGLSILALDRKEWLHLAQALPLGGRKTHVHSCGDGKKLLVTHKAAGYDAWCYRCNIGDFVPKRLTMAERLAKLKAGAEADRRIGSSKAPPMPAIYDAKEWPDEAKVWAYKAGLDNDWLAWVGFYYSPDAERVVMPVLGDAGQLVFWQARGFDPARPKYLSPALGETEAKPIYKSLAFRGVPDPSKLILTEDILSAVRVGEVATGWSLLGTVLTPLSEAQIGKYGASEILVWLDPDEAGVKARRKIVPQLRALGLNAKAVRAELDPKLYPLEEIRRKIA